VQLVFSAEFFKQNERSGGTGAWGMEEGDFLSGGGIFILLLTTYQWMKYLTL
jgi:hypothetical protein